MSIEFASGQIADVAADGADLIRVSVPNLTQLDRVVHGPMRFDPIIQPDGSPLFPVRGDEALVCTDTISGAEWLVQWRPATPMAGASQDTDARLDALEAKTAMLKIGDFVNTGSALTFDNIPQIFSHLRIMAIGQSTRPGFANTGLRATFNSLAGAAYSFDYWGYNSSPAVYSGHVGGDTRLYVGQTPAATRTSDNYVSLHIIDIPFYTLGNINHSFHSNATFNDGSALMTGVNINNIWTGAAAAVTRCDIADDVGSVLGPRARATLYGIL